MALNSTHFFDVYPISPKSNRVAHPDSGMLGETLLIREIVSTGLSSYRLLIINNSYLPVIGVHEMHGRMHPYYWQITILLVVDLCSSLAYFMMTHPLPIAGKLPIKTLVAKQLPTNIIIIVMQ